MSQTRSRIHNPSYTIKITRRVAPEIDDHGSFQEIVDFHVTSPHVPKKKINGCIFQLILKYTNVTVSNLFDDNRIGPYVSLHTSDSISDYTDNMVDWMSTNYMEYFEVRNGIVQSEDKEMFGDAFANGPIAKYEDGIPITDDEKDVSQGSIVQMGIYVFIQESDLLTKIRTAPWNTNEDLPANGLPCLPVDFDIWKTILSGKNSDIYKHEVRHSWIFVQNASTRPNRYYHTSIAKITSTDALDAGHQQYKSGLFTESLSFATNELNTLLRQPYSDVRSKSVNSARHRSPFTKKRARVSTRSNTQSRIKSKRTKP